MNYRNLNLLKTLAAGSAMLGIVLSASAQTPYGPSPSTAPLPAGLNPMGPQYPTPSGIPGVPVTFGEVLYASGGPVYVTDLGPTSAAYDEQLFVASPADGANGLFMDNHTTPNGTTFYLGTFPAGTEVEFGLDVFNTGNIWYDGPGTRNSDGDVHAYVVNNYEGLSNTTYVGFEDLAGPVADFNYVDEVYAFTGTAAAAVPDMGSTLMLLGMSLGGLATMGRRFRK